MTLGPIWSACLSTWSAWIWLVPHGPHIPTVVFLSISYTWGTFSMRTMRTIRTKWECKGDNT